MLHKISTYFLYLISPADVHFVGDGQPHLGGEISPKNVKRDLLRRFWTSVNRMKNDVIAAGQGPGLYIVTQGSQSIDKISVVYRVPATSTWSPRIAYWQSLWMAEMWHTLGCRRWPQSPVASKIKMASTFKRLAIWQSVFLFFGTRSLVKG